MKSIITFLRQLNDKKIFAIFLSIVILFILIPLLQVLFLSFSSDSVYLKTLSETGLLFEGVLNTLELIFKVGFLSAGIGFILSYIMTFYKIKYHKLINILLILPLGIPVYVAAYTYSNIYFDIPLLETIFRSNFFMNGAVFIYVMFLYPYVYIASKSYLSKYLTEYIESARTLNKSNFSIFFTIILPLSRPVIIGAVLFVIFETLSDFAVVEYYGQLTLSRYINIAWFNQGDIHTASRIAIYILLIMFVLISGERLSRKNKRYSDSNNSSKPYVKDIPSLYGYILSYSFILLVITLSFILPIYQMIQSAILNRSYIDRLDIGELIYNTLLVTIISIILIICVSLVVTAIVNYIRGSKKQVLSSLFVLGYSIPSMVLALGTYLFFIKFDQFIYPYLKTIGINTMLITSSIIIIIFAFFFKFFSIAFSNMMSSYSKVDPSLFESAETLGENKLSTMFRVNIPILRKSIIGISIILFIDMVKELTLVYSLRPFNFKTLSTEVYRYAGNEMIEVAAFPSLIIILLCSLLIIYLEAGKKNGKTRKH
mgnify:CR=1 FL=1